MGTRIASKNWAHTPLGPIESWPQSLKNAVLFVLGIPWPNVIYWGPQLIVIYNDAYRPLLGEKPEALGRTLPDVWPEAWDSLRPLLDGVFRGEARRFEQERSVLLRSGHPEEAWFDYSFSPLRNDDGTVTGILNTAIETTGRIRAEQALRMEELDQSRQREFLETLLDNAQACIAVMKGRELRYALVNRAYQALRPGVPMVGRTYREVFPAAVEAGAEAVVQKVIETGEPHADFGYPIPIPGKPDAAGDHRVARLPAAEGEEPSALIITWDATEHKRVENALRESEERYRLAQKAGHVGVFDWHMVTGTSIWSDEMKRIYGLPEDGQAITEKWLEMMHPNDAGQAREDLQTALREKKQGIEGEHRIVRPDGGLRWVYTRGTITYDEAGSPVRMVGTVTDITERKETENSLRENEHRLEVLNESLEEITVQRTEQVRALAKALALAEQRERRRFSYVLHENLQQQLLGARMLLRQHAKDHELARQIEFLDDLRYGLAMLDKALVTTKSLSVELNPPVLHREGLDAALQWLAGHMRNTHGLEVELHLSEAIAAVRDETQRMLTQMVRELLNNVVQHAGVGRAEVDAACEKGAVQITVRDQGSGFDTEKVLTEQNDEARLGLFSIRERLNLFGGGLTVDSAAGKGTRVSITLPADIIRPKATKA